MHNQQLIKRLNFGLFFLLGLYIALTFDQHGISNDEEVQHIYGRLLLNFYNSGFVDQSAFHYKNLYLYGGFFDLIAAMLEKIVPIWIWDMRHLLSAIFGFFGFIASYKIACILKDERAGLLVILLLFLTGSWSGAMFTHTKDVPFATCMTWALYYIIKISRELPNPSLGNTIKLGLAIGCSLGLRVGGIFSIFYLIATISYVGSVTFNQVSDKINFWFVSFKNLLPAAIVAFGLMAIFWPWAVTAPDHPLEAAEAFSHFSFNMTTIIDHHVVDIANVPRYYLIAYLIVRLPEIILIGLSGFVFLAIKNARFIDIKDPKYCSLFIIVLSTLFPLVFTLIDKPALYNGIRHFTFILPPISIISALGIIMTWDYLKFFRNYRIAFLSVIVFLGLCTFITLFKLHPYEYIYYNNLAGNLPEAESDWEADYWSSSLKEASRLLVEEIKQEELKSNVHLTHPYLVAVCAEDIQGQAYLGKNFQVTKNWIAADFYISTTSMNCDKVLRGKMIGKVERMGAILAVIKDRRSLIGPMRLPHQAPRN